MDPHFEGVQRQTLPLNDFLVSIFDLDKHQDAYRSVQLAAFHGSPRDQQNARWAGFRWAYKDTRGQWMCYGELPAGANQYFSVGLLQRDSIGRADHLVYANPLIALDDVGTKVPIPLVQRVLTNHGLLPSAVIETSRENFSLFYKVIERLDLQRGDRVRAALARLGLSDPAVHDRSRYMRLPYGVNGKDPLRPWAVRLATWRPYIKPMSYDIWEDAIRAHGGELTAVHVPVTGERQASMHDRWVQLGAELGLDPHESLRPGVIEMECPFSHEHTAGRQLDGFAFINWGRCHCHHGHCQQRRTPDFLKRMAEMYRERTGEAAGDFFARLSFQSEPLDQADLAFLEDLR